MGMLFGEEAKQEENLEAEWKGECIRQELYELLNVQSKSPLVSY